MPQFVKETTGLEVASAFPSQIRDKTILITGPTIGGIGYDTALSIASQSPRLIILAGRSNEKLAAAAAGIHERYPGATETRNLILDLSSLESVRAAAKEVLDYGVELDVVICNAGIMALPKYHTSKEGFELQFCSNHLGHFLLVNLLMPQLLSPTGAEKRVVVVSSSAYFFSGVCFDDPNFSDGKDYDAWKAYGQSKSANMLFSVSLAKKLGSRGLISFSLHPGSIKTNLQSNVDREQFTMLCEKHLTPDHKDKTLQQGCSTTMVAAFDPIISDYSGGNLNDCQLEEVEIKWGSDPESAEKLWEMSEKMVGQRFDYN